MKTDVDNIIKNCTENDLPAIQDIFNEAILNSTALYDYVPRSREVMEAWYASKLKGNYPVVGCYNSYNELLGFATYGAFRVHAAYKYSVEHSLYIKSGYRGIGIGKGLLSRIILEAQNQNFHTLIGAIDNDNAVSIKLHEKMGFVLSGVIKQAGYKFGRWLDLAFYQLVLPTPMKPEEV